MEEEKNLVNLSSKVVLDANVSKSVHSVTKLGEDQFNKFFENRLQSEKESLYDVISKNRLQLFKQSNVSQSSSKAKQKMDSVVADPKLFSRLFIACQSRTGDLQDFFFHENHSYPISISEYGKLRKCTGKSDFLKCLNEIIDPSEEQPVTQVKIIDGWRSTHQYEPTTLIKSVWRLLS